MSFGLFAFLYAFGFLFLWLILRGHVRKKTAPNILLERVENEIQDLIAELNETVDRNITLLEDQIRTAREAVDALRDARNEAEMNLIPEQGVKEEGTEAPESEAFVLDLQSGRVEDLPVYSTSDRAIRLHQSGLSSDIIAGQLNLAVGEVELILSLHNGRDRGRSS